MKVIKDKYFNTIGFTEEVGSKTVIKDRDFNTQGFFDERTNRTMDKDFRTVGYGNQLMSLLNNKKK